MDRTIVNLVSIVLGGAGLFAVLTGYHVPELSKSYFGENPFAVKRDAIESVNNWVFALVTLGGLFLQVVAEIWGADLVTRAYTTSSYVRFTVACIIVASVAVWLLAKAVRAIARPKWLPVVRRGQSELFRRADFVTAHDGWEEEHLREIDTIPEAKRPDYVKTNLQTARERVEQIEKLFDVEPKGTIAERIQRLRPLFDSRVMV
jgi:hypothetical protein